MDLTRADLLSSRWLAYVELILAEQDSEDLKEFCTHSSRRSLMNALALVAGRSQSFDVLKQLSQTEQLAHEQLLRILLGVEPKSRQEYATEMTDLWVANFGDPNNPDVQDAIEQTAQALLQAAA